MKPAIYGSTRALHLYLGLFLSPFLLLFALSTLAFNHPSKAALSRAAKPVTLKSDIPVQVPSITDALEQAKAIRAQLGLTGEIDFVRHSQREQKLVIPLVKPGELTTVEVDLKKNTATIRRQEQGTVAGLSYLHKMPGPHLAKFRGNWLYMRAWAVVTDAVVYILIFVTVTGLYLWWFIKAERTFGWVLLSAGVLSTLGLVLAVVWPWEPLVR